MTTRINAAKEETCALAPSNLGENSWDMRCPYNGARCGVVSIAPPQADDRDLSLLTRVVLAISLIPPGTPLPTITQEIREDRPPLPPARDAA